MALITPKQQADLNYLVPHNMLTLSNTGTKPQSVHIEALPLGKGWRKMLLEIIDTELHNF